MDREAKSSKNDKMKKAKKLAKVNQEFINLRSCRIQIIMALRYDLEIITHPSIGPLLIIIKLLILEDISLCHISTIIINEKL